MSKNSITNEPPLLQKHSVMYCFFSFSNRYKMKTLRNKERKACGVDYPLFAIMKDLKNGHYHYYTQVYKAGNEFSYCILISKKTWILNRITLSILGFIHTTIHYLILIPVAFILWPITHYYDGAKNFIKNGEWQDNVRFFNWCNFIVIPLLIVWIILK